MNAGRLARAAALAAAGAALLAGGACKDSTLPASLVGTYDLTTFNGKSLPTLYASLGASRFEVTGGYLDLKSAGDFTMTLFIDSIGPNQNPATPVTEDTAREVSTTLGPVTQSGNTLHFAPRFENAFTGTVSGNTITVTRNSGGVTLTFTFVREGSTALLVHPQRARGQPRAGRGAAPPLPDGTPAGSERA